MRLLLFITSGGAGGAAAHNKQINGCSEKKNTLPYVECQQTKNNKAYLIQVLQMTYIQIGKGVHCLPTVSPSVGFLTMNHDLFLTFPK